MLEFKTAICNELGEFVCWCSDISIVERDNMLDEHPEYTMQCLPCTNDGLPDFGALYGDEF